jgi:hypothetical protein
MICSIGCPLVVAALNEVEHYEARHYGAYHEKERNERIDPLGLSPECCNEILPLEEAKSICKGQFHTKETQKLL